MKNFKCDKYIIFGTLSKKCLFHFQYSYLYCMSFSTVEQKQEKKINHALLKKISEHTGAIIGSQFTKIFEGAFLENITNFQQARYGYYCYQLCLRMFQNRKIEFHRKFRLNKLLTIISPEYSQIYLLLTMGLEFDKYNLRVRLLKSSIE